VIGEQMRPFEDGIDQLNAFLGDTGLRLPLAVNGEEIGKAQFQLEIA
jgi:hypothetical protein